MFMVFPMILGLGISMVSGGDLRKLARIRFGYVWLLWAALATQVWLIARPGPQSAFLTALELGAYPLALAFLFLNRHIPGMRLIVVGAGLNFLAMAANGGVMPAASGAVQLAGLPRDFGGVYANSAFIPHPHLLLIGDIFAIPSAIPFANVFSIGDILIAVGGIVVILRTTRRTVAPGPSDAESPDAGSDESFEIDHRLASGGGVGDADPKTEGPPARAIPRG